MAVPTTQWFRTTTALSLEIELNTDGVLWGTTEKKKTKKRKKHRGQLCNAESPGLIGIDGQQKQQRVAFVDGHDKGVWQTATSFAHRTT